MRLKTAAVVIVVLLLGGLTIKRIATSSQEEEKWEDRNSVRAVARRSKAKGTSKVVIPGPIVEYPGLNSSVDDLLQNSSVVVASPVGSKSYLVHSHSIGTWYKFKISETISLRPPSVCTTCPDAGNPPRDFRPTLSDEFLLSVDGGTLLTDGVEVTQNSQSFPRFQEGNHYLLFISFLPGDVARLAAGPAAVFIVQTDGTLDGVDNKKHRTYDDVRTRFSKTLSKLKAHFNP